MIRSLPLTQNPTSRSLYRGESKRKLAAKKAAQRALSNGILAGPNAEDGRGDMGSLSVEDNTRLTFAHLLGSASDQQWKGLAKGSNANGTSFTTAQLLPRANFMGKPASLLRKLRT